MRGITQASAPQSSISPFHRPQSIATNGPPVNGTTAEPSIEPAGIVYKPTTNRQLDELLSSARDRCAVIFFTSATCPPCKIVYPAFDELAASVGHKAVLIKVDLSDAYEIGSRYQIRVTPTFWTFLKGKKEDVWTGANEAQLRGNVNLLLQMVYPAHPHTLLRLPTLHKPHKQLVTYTKIPPLDKITAKLGPPGADPAVVNLSRFIAARKDAGAMEAPLPELRIISTFILKSLQELPVETLFPLVDLLRLAFVDSRVSGYFATDFNGTLGAILERTTRLDTECPYQLRIVTLHLACNAFTSTLLQTKLLSDPKLSSLIIQIVTSSLLDPTHLPIRVAAASLAFNIAASNHLRRLVDQSDLLSEGGQVELMASLLEAMSQERESLEGLRGMLYATGFLAYKVPKDEELEQICEAVGAKDIVKGTKGVFKELKDLATEVEQIIK